MLKAKKSALIPYKVCASYRSSIFLKGNSESVCGWHPSEGSPSGGKAYPVTEKMEELKEEEKNDMAKKNVKCWKHFMRF